ncbi:uncharacterized protein VTP21DRAFT_3378 [Calcarisporiella thermophila]|uniref:uncharacterized protein n=1 Tax=Calcarisporiella thermophila TaxID=911321 RepID=UPI003742FA75
MPFIRTSIFTSLLALLLFITITYSVPIKLPDPVKATGAFEAAINTTKKPKELLNMLTSELLRNGKKKGQIFTGQGTFYDVGADACGSKSKNSDMVAALNAPQFGKGDTTKNRNCGRRVLIFGPKGMVVVKIVDLCPGCKNGDLDLSPTAFKKIANLSQGRVPIKWKFL